ncbi:MAG: ATP-binding protein, partial [Desulfuromonadales bacterium]
FELVQEPFALKKFVEGVLHSQQPALEAKGLRLEVHLDKSLPQEVVGDRLRIEQVLSNLLSNAVKFTERGRISFEAAVKEQGEDSATVRFTVSDTGIGLEQDFFEKIFQPFTQGDSSITRQYGGTGLGLAISKELVEKMGGTIVPQNNAQGGAVFHVTLPFPLAGAQNPDGTTGGPPQSALEQEEPFGYRVLLAEDDQTNRNLMILLLEKMGVEVTAVVNGREAVEELTATPFDLVLMDVSMPELDGVTATRRVRALPSDHPNRTIPVIALTAHARLEDRNEFLDAGMSEVLSMPFDNNSLRELLQRFDPGREQGTNPSA